MAKSGEKGGPGPLTGIRVLELGGQGPVPFCAMTLADLGAEVVTVRRPGPPTSVNPHNPGVDRGRRFIAVDLKAPLGIELIKRLSSSVDVLLEGFRPRVLERLGLGPVELLASNPMMVIGRMTGWGQEGPWALQAGHDINYIAMTGALEAIGEAGGAPVVPLNLVGDYAGGAMYLALGVITALFARDRVGHGEVVDAAITDGVGHLMSVVRGLSEIGRWNPERGSNLLDGGAPFYRVYQCADGGFMAVGALEDSFYKELLAGLGVDSLADLPADRMDKGVWQDLTNIFSAAFLSQPRRYWEEVFATKDACVTPVLSMREAEVHPLAVSRNAFARSADGTVLHPSPAPRFGSTPLEGAAHQRPEATDVNSLLRDLGLSTKEISELIAEGVVSPAEW